MLRSNHTKKTALLVVAVLATVMIMGPSISGINSVSAKQKYNDWEDCRDDHSKNWCKNYFRHHNDHDNDKKDKAETNSPAFLLPITFGSSVPSCSSRHNIIYRLVETAIIIAFLEIGDDRIFSNGFSSQIGDHSFQSITHLDSYFPVALPSPC